MIAAGIGFFAGFRYVASAANPKEREAAKTMLEKVFIGLIVVLFAWYIVDFIIDLLSHSNTVL